MVRTYLRAPRLPEPTFLQEWRVSIVRPIGRTNLVANPSVETNTTGWSSIGVGSVARSTTYAYHGAYSLQAMTGSVTDGAFYGTVSLIAGTTYAASVKFLAPDDAGRSFSLSFRTTGGVALQTHTFIATGRWQWIWVLYTETSSTTRRIYIAKNGGSLADFYLDGLQVEACETGNYWPTTYIDGDQQGLLGAVELPAYYWTGTPHASTSVRSGQTRAGGRAIPLEQYGLCLTSIQGLGLAPVQSITTPFGQLDGAQFLDLRKDSRPVTLTGRWAAKGPRTKERQIAALAADLDRDLIATRQPLTILLEPMADGLPIRAPFVVPALAYVGGLEGDLTGLPTEESIISFTQYIPRIGAGESGVTLDVQDSLSEAAVLKRSREGVWSIPGSPYLASGTMQAITLAPTGTVYTGANGNITLSDASTLPGIAQLVGSTWSGLSTGVATATQVFAIAVGPDGKIYAGGGFTTAGGGAANRIAVWDGSAWAALGTGLNNICRGITFGADGTLYATGDFTTAGGGAAASIASWNGSAWSALSTGLNSAGQCLATGLDGRIYVGGNFSTAGGVSAAAIAVWNGSAFAALGSGMNNAVRSIVFGPNGVLYAGGDFTTAGGIAANYVAAWNGSSWSALGTGITGTNVAGLAVSRITGLLYAVGRFTAADGHPATHFAVWNGSSWASGDISTTNPAGSISVAPSPDGSLYMAVSVVGSFATLVAAQTTATNLGTADVYPRLVVNGPSSGTGNLLYLANATTGVTIYLDLDISTGETVTFDFRPTVLSVTSTTRGNRLATILPGSDLATFALQPGANTISFLCDTSTMTAVLSWPNDLASLADGWIR